ncbi:phosphatase PAP2 family protein [Paenibacillus macerans]|uniref:PAP2 superfamily protein n=1 Tax=Paenibacillus macerans TaxID=44252 RepID=A0A090Y8X2_PAEMA|nr:phosphatase PAP2 family protein [Paenibacillus macerans]KFM94277.1 PAP2 superfamily protein [Paenibacillus macerans]MCY7561830.1 phosphatase PAP2 family protein [Paenibacillus macerans]MEC0149707.1 phosphatase PAP2 family protein [Paenibacillus macerans]UMV48444.1 phosphatase PAP2 family protein [Paenibacillus macerans]SUD25569.1 phosphoesterase PA-phosphatase-like protein [Paenibacillus macerans]
MRYRYYERLREYDNRLFFWCNHKLSHPALDLVLKGITHLGGAAFTIAVTLSVILFAAGPWPKAGWKSLCALALSHLAAVLVKRTFQRTRPYAALRGARISIRPLKDYSFPSGHTTAAFSIAVPFLFTAPGLAQILLPLAFIVGMSRIYLGVHCPSDCLAGGLIGALTALLVVLLAGAA